MEEIIKKVCFTGKRPDSMPWGTDESDPRCAALKQKLTDAIERAIADGYTYFITGMALGADTWAGEAVVQLRAKYPDLYLEAAVPCLIQPKKWTEEEQIRYFDLLFECNKKTLCSPSYHKGCYLVRNRYMVDAAQRVIAVYNGSGGGTGYTLRYAQGKDREIEIISF